ncbi:hypothetical protein Pcinc_001117 [Petrolisthes cinctipes]|uniref:Uncharacterized protein n=1 Tax=Petrolisthes cinctipes TaxID=88211 RepID=A0AAE1GNJ0_PETCI|nr:hypothetical protein Pcinc_001117 [Petrolisthes cinctipes]
MADIMVWQQIERIYESPEFTESFFKFVTERVVLARVKSEMGEVEVTTLLNRLTSWSVEALVKHMNIVIYSWGLCQISGFPKFGKVVHGRDRWPLTLPWYPEFEKIWAVVAVQNAVGVGPPLNVYVALSDFEYETEFLKNIPEEKSFLKQTSYYYSTKLWYFNDYGLLMGFDFEDRKHWAIVRMSRNHPVFVLEREEMRAREFLACLSRFMKGEIVIKDFLCYFTRLSTIKREEALEIMHSNLPLPLSLSETAYQIVCQLPLCYVHQYAPPLLYKTIRCNHSVVGTPAPYRKSTQNVVKQLDLS